MSSRAATLEPEVEVARALAPSTAPPFLWAFRRQFMLLDVLYLGFVGALLIWALVSWIAPEFKLYETSHRFDWALESRAALTANLALFLGAYLVLQRFGIRFQRDYYARGLKAPRWLEIMNLLYTFSPAVLAPMLFQGLGSFMAVVSGVPGVETHAAFDPAMNYDRAATWFDLQLKQLDIATLGVYLPQWSRQYHSPWLCGLLFIGYLAYYVCPFVAALPQVIKGNWAKARLASAMSVGCLLLTYLLYILVPATGPRFEGGWDLWAAAPGTWFGAHELGIYIDQVEEIRWDAFPSGHVCTSVTCLIVALVMHRRVGLAYLPFVAGLVIATIFLGYHYATDVVVGFACVGISFAVIWPLVKWWEKATNPALL